MSKFLNDDDNDDAKTIAQYLGFSPETTELKVWRTRLIKALKRWCGNCQG